MTAYGAFVEVLDINETIEELKNRNVAKQPDTVLCKTVELLEHYRGVLSKALKNTTLKFD